MKQFESSSENNIREYIYEHRFICEIHSDEDIIDINENTEETSTVSIHNKHKQIKVKEDNDECIRVNLPSQSKMSPQHKRKKLKKKVDNKELLLSSNAQCSICLNTISTLASPNTCGHDFCKECFMKWTTDFTNQCPLCKKEFFSIISYEHNKRKEINVKRKRIQTKDYATPEDKCYVCNSSNNKEEMLVCCECCVNICHLACDGLTKRPKHEWMCLVCRATKEERRITKRIGRTFIY